MTRRFITSASLSFASLLLFSAAAGSAQDVPIDLSSDSARVERGALTAPSSRSKEDVVRGYLTAKGRASDTLTKTGEGKDLSGEVSHLRFGQEISGLTVYGTYVKAAVSRNGELLSIIDNIVDRPGNGFTRATISPKEALDITLRQLYGSDAEALSATARETGRSGNLTSFEKGTFFHTAPTATRVLVPLRGDALKEGFLVETWGEESNALWHTVVGPTGKILLQELRTAQDSYNIYPIHPDAGPQTIVQGPGAGNTQSPSGWVFTNTTTGNNVDAYLDRDATANVPDPGGRPTSATKDFLNVFDVAAAPTTLTNQMAAVQNLFYLNNLIHDELYKHGFNEANLNFQEDNFGKGGLGSDSVNAEAQDGGGTNNANFSTPSDGSNPRMQMYLWTAPTPDRDGDVDSDIVWHEYCHGLSWRMIGSMSGRMSGAIGEGNSDAFACVYNNQDMVGEYATMNTTRGIRRYRYSGYPLSYNDMVGSSVHSDGEIYAAAVWRTWELWRQLYPSAGFNRDLLMGYMVDGMNYTPSAPDMEAMRDGILASINNRNHADEEAHKCRVWHGFAQLGIGEGANGSCGAASCTIVESFTVPAAYASCLSGGNANPTANFTFTTSGLTANFTDTSTDDGSIASWSWNFGDSGTSTSQNPSHTYSAGGTYNVTLTVTDNLGATGSVTKPVTVTAPPPPGSIVLSAVGRKVKGLQMVDLKWTGATANLDVYRNGVIVITNTPNDGAQTDNINKKGSATYTHKVCHTGTSTCSNTTSVTF